MMTLPLHHVSFRGRGPMVGPRPMVRYFSVAAKSASDALRLVEDQLNGADGEYRIERTDRVGVEPGIMSQAQLAC